MKLVSIQLDSNGEPVERTLVRFKRAGGKLEAVDWATDSPDIREAVERALSSKDPSAALRREYARSTFLVVRD